MKRFYLLNEIVIWNIFPILENLNTIIQSKRRLSSKTVLVLHMDVMFK